MMNFNGHLSHFPGLCHKQLINTDKTTGLLHLLKKPWRPDFGTENGTLKSEDSPVFSARQQNRIQNTKICRQHHQPTERIQGTSEE
jgi:hypothetical protein